MATSNLGSLLYRNGANYIFNNNRLLVGLLERENQKIEAWFSQVLSPDGTGEVIGWSVYTSANGSEQLITAMSRLHPAPQAHFVGGNTKAYFSMSTMEQVDFLARRYYDVVEGRAEYCQHQGGELKTMANVGVFPRINVGNAPQSRSAATRLCFWMISNDAFHGLTMDVGA